MRFEPNDKRLVRNIIGLDLGFLASDMDEGFLWGCDRYDWM